MWFKILKAPEYNLKKNYKFIVKLQKYNAKIISYRYTLFNEVVPLINDDGIINNFTMKKGEGHKISI